MVANMKQLKATPADKMPEPASTMHINMNKHDLGNIEVGKTMKMNVEAKVVSHSEDEYGHNARLEVTKMTTDNPRGNAGRDR